MKYTKPNPEFCFVFNWWKGRDTKLDTHTYSRLKLLHFRAIYILLQTKPDYIFLSGKISKRKTSKKRCKNQIQKTKWMLTRINQFCYKSSIGNILPSQGKKKLTFWISFQWSALMNACTYLQYIWQTQAEDCKSYPKVNINLTFLSYFALKWGQKLVCYATKYNI